MRCKKHLGDFSSSVGVCATCLRERLLSLIAAQAQLSQQQAQLARAAALHDARNSDPQGPPPLLFPRSVSPYVTRRKSDDASSWSHHLRFYSTPQVGPTYNTSSSAAPTSSFGSSGTKKKHRTLSLLSNLFRSRSDKFNTDPTGSDPAVPSRDSSQPSSSSPSWFSTIFIGRQKKQSKHFAKNYSDHIGRKPRRRVDRGMSPARVLDSDENCEDCDVSPTGSGYSSESSQGWKRTPVAAAATRRGKQGHARNVSSLAFCLSPLVRASPNHHWNQKGGFPPEIGLSGEVRAPVKPHLSTAASFCANRSRKLADFGRMNHNR